MTIASAVSRIADTSRLVKFYSAPFAAIVAAISANLFVRDQEEEEERMAGALSPDARGALTV